MESRQYYVPPEGPPQGAPNPNIYKAMGSENIYKMIADFYLLLKKSPIGSLFPEDILEASKKSADFFIFLLGGPPVYQQKYGPPMMRKRHLPFKIDEQARQIWLSCFEEVLVDADKKYNFPLEYLEGFRTFLDRFSAWMVNSK